MGKQCSDLRGMLSEEIDARGLPCFHPLEAGSLTTLLTEIAARVPTGRENHLSLSCAVTFVTNRVPEKVEVTTPATNTKVFADGSRVSW